MKRTFAGIGRTSFSRLLVVWSLLFTVPFGCGGGGGGGSDGAPSNPPASNPPAFPPPLAISLFVSGLASPVGLESSNDSTGRLFVIEQGGAIRIIRSGALSSAAFLDVSARVESGGEKGLLGLAFHPNFSVNRRFFVNYTRRITTQLQTVISEFLVSAVNPDLADPSSERQLLVVDQPFDNHNGGQLAFGPDGFLYIALGDGGSGGDPLNNGQNPQTLLGKILRIDVDGAPVPGRQYAVPVDNPFAGGGGLPEIWALGLRNPWRFSFDHATGRGFAGDVGEANWEEVDLIARGGNFGWNRMEGNHCFPPGTTCGTTGLVLPIAEHGHDAAGGTSIVGGFVYRGSAIPGLVGTYIFGDLSSGRIWGLKEDVSGNWERTVLLTHNLIISSFGRDAAGELYLVDYAGGAILRLLPGP